METWLQERPQGPCRALFLTRRGQTFSVRGIQERVEHYARQAGLHVTCHQLRHTCARRLAEGRMPLASLASWLGHASPTTTQVYINGANLSVRADYEATRNRLQAERPQPPTVSSAQSSVQFKASVVPAGQPVEEWPYPELSVQDIRERVTSLPDWLQPWLEEWILVQQARWLPRYRRQRARQWLREVQKAWTWLVSQRSIQGFADLQEADLMAYLETGQDRVAPGTVNHSLTSFWSFLRYVEAQNQPIAPGLYRMPRPKQSERLPRPLKEEAYQRLEQTVLEATAKGGLLSCLDQLCFFLMAQLGCASANSRTCAWRIGIPRNSVWWCAKAKTTRTGQSLSPLRPQLPRKPTGSCASQCPCPICWLPGTSIGTEFHPQSLTPIR